MKSSERFAWFSLGAVTVLIFMILAVAESAALPQTVQIVVTAVLAAAVVALNADRVRLNKKLKQAREQTIVLVNYASRGEYAKVSNVLSGWSRKFLQEGRKP